MLYSNNFIANQIFLAVGAAEFGYPATWEKSKQAVAGLLQEKFNLSAEDIRIVEGSGLSRKNRVSPLAMLKLLDFFKPYSRLLPEKDGIFMKSGTLEGVYSYAGYFTEKEETDSFVLLLNQERNNRDMVLLLLEVLYRKR
jgi:D-alanyl-D-alanine carboxypeptidase/D-alanyl-D-alanine-endopeptidase (penicillin-binding protein 4)